MTTASLCSTLETGLTAAAASMVSTAAPVDSEELALVRQAAAGDSRAFEKLYRLHVDRIYGLCCRLCNGDTARADQSTQDAFVRAWEKLGSFRGESRFGTWLHRLTVNVVLGEHRLLKRWVTFEDGTSTEEESAADAAMPLQQEDSGLKMDLERALSRLPNGARTVLVLHDIEGYQHEEIASLTGIAVGTSKAQLHRARRLMRGWLQ